MASGFQRSRMVRLPLQYSPWDADSPVRHCQEWPSAPRLDQRVSGPEDLSFYRGPGLAPQRPAPRKTTTPPHLMASLELGELAHEGSSDIGIDLAVKKDWPVGFPKLRGELVQVVQSADG